MTYAFDGFTNTGVTGSLQATKNLMAQVGISPAWIRASGKVAGP